MKTQALNYGRKSIRLMVVLLSLSVSVLSVILPVTAAGYDAEAARTDVTAPETVIDILTLNPDNLELDKTVWYGIYDAAGLAHFSSLVNQTLAFRGKEIRVCLCSSIDLSEVSDLLPIGNGINALTGYFPSASFNGTFDGRGYVIHGLTAKTYEGENGKNGSYTSLFGAVGANAVIRNLVIGADCVFAAGAEYSNNSCVASLASRVAEGAEIRNILNLAPVSGGVFCGGLIARVDGIRQRSGAGQAPLTLTDCTNAGSTAGGGLIGTVRGNLVVTDCVVSGSETSPIGTVDSCVAYSDTDFLEVSVTISGVSARTDRMIGKTAQNDVAVSQTNCKALKPDEQTKGAEFHGIQLAEEPNGRINLRFIASVDSAQRYSEVGFIIRMEGSTGKDFACTRLFRSLLGQGDDGTVCYTAKELRGEDGYLFAATLKGGILADGMSVSFSVTAYAKAAETGEQSTTETYTLTLTKTGNNCTVTWKK